MKKQLLILVCIACSICGCRNAEEDFCNKALPLDSGQFRNIASMGERFAAVVKFVDSNDLGSLSPGRYEILGDDVYCNVSIVDLRDKDKAGFEVHEKYYDIHLPIDQDEMFGIKHVSECTAPTGPMDPAIDAQLFTDKVEKTVLVHPGEAIIFAPGDAHSPNLGFGKQTKIVFKVKK